MPDRPALDLTASCPVVLFLRIAEPRPRLSPHPNGDWEYFWALLTFATMTSFSATFALFTSGGPGCPAPQLCHCFFQDTNAHP